MRVLQQVISARCYFRINSPQKGELFNNNYDKFLLNFKDKLKTKFKNYLHTHIEYNLINAGKKKVLEVNCTKSKEAVFISENDFYVRTNLVTEKLEGKELLNYSKHRF